jgi:putative ABC transport system permease protein
MIASLRSLLRKPWYSISIAGVIALGFALLTAVFAVVDGVLFKSLGYPSERQLVAVEFSSSHSRFASVVNSADLASWTQATPGVAFTGMRVQPFRDVGDGINQPTLARALVQANFFDVIGVRPAIGGFAPEDFAPSPSRIEPRILTDDVFRAQFGGNAAIIGRTVVLDPSAGSGYRVVGVMPRGFVFPSDVWTVAYLAPYVPSPQMPGRRDLTQAIARLPSAAGAPSASEVESRVLAAETARRDPSDREPVDRVSVQELSRAVGAKSRPLFEALLAAALLIVAVAALNASSLMAARAIDRVQELSMRRALGATAIDIARLLFSESIALVGAGGAIGLALASPLLRFVLHLLPEDLVLLRPAAIDWRVGVFAAVVAAALACLSTVWPMQRALSGRGLLPGRGATEPARSIGRRLVIGAQVAAAVVLTVAGALLVSSLLTVYAQTPAITTQAVLTIEGLFEGLPPARASRLRPELAVRLQSVLDRLRSVPGVQSVAATSAELLDGGSMNPWFKEPDTAGARSLQVDMQAVTSDYYRVVQPRLVAGRLPTDAELAHDDPVIVVSEGVARAYWPNASAVGQTLTDQGANGTPGPTFTVVGVVKDVRWWSWDVDSSQIYGPYATLVRWPFPTFLIRTSGNPRRVTQDALQAIATVDPMLKPIRAAMLDDLFVDSVRPRRFRAWLFGSFAVACLFVVGIGILGQLAMATARRTREVGVRMACGATPVRIVGLLSREQLGPVLMGLVAGLIGAAWAVRLVRGYLYQLTPYDARVWAGALGLILATAALGTIIPALRASRINPTRALREG